MLFRSGKLKIMAAAIIMSSLFSMTSMAQIVEGINGGPGVSMGPAVTETAPGTIETGSQPVTVPSETQPAPGTAVTVPADQGQSDLTSGPGYTPGEPSNTFTDNQLSGSLGPDNSDLSLTSDVGSVKPDPVLGQMFETHGQLMQTNGMLSDGFTSNMDFFNSPTDGFSGLKLRINVGIGDIFYRVYTEEHGWTKWAMNDMITPLYGDNAKVTAVQIRAQGYTRNLYDIYYRVTLNDGTVLDWAHDGQTSGTIGTGRYIQSIQMKLWQKIIPS